MKKINRGAEFYKCALQVNPYGYKSQFRGQPEEGDAYSHAVAIVNKAVELDISVLAITNHNDVSAIPAFQEAARSKKTASGKDIIIFPGFELASSEGIDVLCIYPLEVGQEELGRHLGGFGIKSAAPSTEVSCKNFTAILQSVKENGGVAIAAHSTTSSGLLRGLSGQGISGQPLIKAWRDKNLLAIQIPGSVKGLDQKYRQIIQNKNSDYRRDNPVAQDLALAVINSRDVTDPSTLEDDSAYCKIRMSKVSIEGLRQAFLDPESRIRLNSDPDPVKHSELTRISWEGGFLNGITVDFNSNLNVLIGGRGAGKSAVLESIRYALGLVPISKDAEKLHESFVKEVFGGSGSRVSLEISIHAPTLRKYRIQRTIPNPPIVYDEDESIIDMQPVELISGISIYGQHELLEISKNQETQIHLLDRFSKPNILRAESKAILFHSLEENRFAIVKCQDNLDRIDEELVRLPGIEEKLKSYKKTGIQERLSVRTQFDQEKEKIETVTELFKMFNDWLSDIQGQLPIDTTFISERRIEGFPNVDILREYSQALANFGRQLERLVDEWDQLKQISDRELASLKSRWDERKEKIDEDYNRILRELKDHQIYGAGSPQIDGAEFIKLNEQVKRLSKRKTDRVALEKLMEAYKKQRKSLLYELETYRSNKYEVLDMARKEINRQLRGVVEVNIIRDGNREPLCKLIKSIGERLNQAINAIASEKSFSLAEFVEHCKQGAEKLRQTYGFTLRQAEIIAKMSSDTLMRMEEVQLLPTLEFKLNISGSKNKLEWRQFENLSTGQRATVVLLLLLLESEFPLIIDQPEDDLDNRFISETIIPLIRSQKSHRQFIFATHNANIPVLGDAEQILGLTDADSSGKDLHNHAHISSEHVGAIDSSSVRELVEEILEGGKEAFERRRLKYGF